MSAPNVIHVDMDYRPLEHWAAQWGKPEEPLPISTIKTWIRNGTCPAKKIGGRWMISQLELLNWEPPQEGKAVVQSRRGKTGRPRRDLRKAIGGQSAPGQDDRRPEARWPC